MSKLIVLDFLTQFQPLEATQNYFSSGLKQQALISDQIGILHLTGVINSYLKFFDGKEGRNQLDSLNLDIEWLKESEIIFEIEPIITEEFLQTNIGQYFASKVVEEATEWNNFSDKIEKDLLKYGEVGNISKDNINIQDVKNLVKLANSRKKLDELILRTISLDIELKQRNSVVAALSLEDYLDEAPYIRKSNVTQVVISNLPLPNNETPWEQIIDYRNDPDNQKNLLNLRRWIRKISTETISPKEIEEEIEWLISEFENNMKIHKMKANTETLEVIVKTPFEFIENLVKLKFSKIPEPLFAFKKRQINLLEAEQNAPGREMAYIIKARDTFQSDE